MHIILRPLAILATALLLIACGEGYEDPRLEFPEGGGPEISLLIGESDSTIVEFGNSGGLPLTLEIEEFEIDWLTISPMEAEIAPDETQEFTINATCPEEQGGYEAVLLLDSNDPGSPHEFHIYMHCNSLPDGSIQLEITGLPAGTEPTIWLLYGENQWRFGPNGNIDRLTPDEYTVDPEPEIIEGTIYRADSVEVTVISEEEVTVPIVYVADE